MKRGRRGRGEGSIRKRKDGLWEGRYTVNVELDGKPKRKSVYGKSSNEVRRKLLKVLSSIEEGSYIEQKKITVSQWLNTWFEDYKKPTVKSNTLACYENIIIKHINPVIGEIQIKDLRVNHVQRLYNTVAKNYSRRMVELTHVTLHNALEKAIKNNLLIRNISKMAEIPKGKDQKYNISSDSPKALTVEEQKVLLQALKGERLEAAFLIMLFTGLRRGELLGLKWQDIDMEKRLLYVNRLLCRYKNYNPKINRKTILELGTLKTTSSKRNIPLIPELIPVLKAHKIQQNIELLKAGSNYKFNNLIFCNKIGEPIDPRRLKTEFDKILEKACMAKLPMPKNWSPGTPIPKEFKFPKWFTPPSNWMPGTPFPSDFKIPQGVKIHTLRHTFATRGLENGIELKVMQELLGHSTITITGDIYSHVLPDKKEEAINKLRGIFK